MGKGGCTGNKKLEKAELFMTPLWLCSIEKAGNGSTSSDELKIAQTSSAPPTFPSCTS